MSLTGLTLRAAQRHVMTHRPDLPPNLGPTCKGILTICGESTTIPGENAHLTVAELRQENAYLKLRCALLQAQLDEERRSK